MASSQQRITAKDWSATQYLKFEEQRTRPARDLLAQVPLTSPRRIVDLGCGPGNSTALLAAKYPEAAVSGVDSSPNMISKAQEALLAADHHRALDFSVGDLREYRATQPMDLIFSNATFQWLGTNERIKAMRHLIEESLSPGGVLAIQIPDNLDEPSHALMRDTAASGPWAETLAASGPGRTRIQSVQELYDQLIPYCSSLDIWHTVYQHPLDSHGSIVEWLKGTALRAFIDPLADHEREDFLAAYLARIKEAYPASNNGRVLLRFPRLFLVATKIQQVTDP
ncbi:hypothetical protein NLG97_g827 [Lecanicillium saksenae]|uniref:Uncharacterized protein n=1 Tax=Lecanicillium saksenae TaxID=468837 RepID=A0ACC1R640_9HYPO|nr:hypothetical protein NLG97_g827 [Lecanicillium saksenae]